MTFPTIVTFPDSSDGESSSFRCRSGTKNENSSADSIGP